ncbi:acyltransferase family protein [Azohydromonas caseinilytica]|uniref:Acyltransferase n=1 Tax=Azohydromonas caseinilytica TaxID=2728836 RepID=A0A848F8J9_9BURK|nr:acyltransferase [Azohydromonas caseinilytica]NML15086.1 acyltransferase [Azohydromonas caseinilytica]
MHIQNNFDGLRLLGAMLVLVSHQFALSGRPEPHLVSSVSYGALGVLIFFSISGYLVGKSWLKDPHPQRFAMRRLLRIWPGLAAVVLITTLGAFIATGTVAQPAYLANLLLLNIDGRFFPGNPLPHMNGSLWTIPLEILCYVALVALGVASGARLRLVVLVLACVAGPLYMLLVGPLVESGAVRPGIRLLPYFSAFFFAGVLHAWRQPSAGTVALLCAAGAASIAAKFNLLGLLLIVPATVIFIGTRSWPLLNQAGRFGDLSYGIYLWAWPVQQLGVLLLTKNQPLGLLLALSVAGTLVLAWLSWHFIEKPALQMKPAGSSLSPRAAALDGRAF